MLYVKRHEKGWQGKQIPKPSRIFAQKDAYTWHALKVSQGNSVSFFINNTITFRPRDQLTRNLVTAYMCLCTLGVLICKQIHQVV